MQHCFVIDDSEIIRKYTRLIFESLGYRVSEADSAIAAMERLRSEKPDYILLDWRMPGTNSIELLEKIRALPRGDHPYIIYMVTENDPLEIQRAISRGANTHLLKPYNRQIIEIKLQEIRAAA